MLPDVTPSNFKYDCNPLFCLLYLHPCVLTCFASIREKCIHELIMQSVWCPWSLRFNSFNNFHEVSNVHYIIPGGNRTAIFIVR
jgi:hypothetical protein